jgi:predicted glutamine amidotransferase
MTNQQYKHMCGIIFGAYFGNKLDEPINDCILDQFQEQALRGTQGFGAVFIDSKTKKFTLKRSTRETKATIDLTLNQSGMILFHHRQPTSSDNHLDQTHPILVSNKIFEHDYLVVHNGIINNAEIIKLEHEKLGFEYTTQHDVYYGTNPNHTTEKFNDSETIAIDLALFIEKQIDHISAKGSAALVCLQINKKTQTVNNIFFTRNSSPLNMFKRQDKLFLSSEGQGEPIKEDKLYSCDTTEFKLKQIPMVIDHYVWTPPVTIPVAKPAIGFQTSNNFPTTANKLHQNKPQTKDVDYPQDKYAIDIESEIEYIAEITINPLIDTIIEDVKDDVAINTIDIEETVASFKLSLEQLINDSKDIHMIKSNQQPNEGDDEAILRNKVWSD